MGSQAATGVLGALGLAALLVFVPVLWRRSVWFCTFVHESGHALMATLTGRLVEAMKVFRDGDGCTKSYGKPTGLARVATAASGYLAPPAAGLGIVAALEAGVSARTMLLVVIFVVVALLLVTGDAFTAAIVVTVLAVLALLLHRAGPISQTVAALTAAWFLLLAGLRDSLELSTVINRGAKDDASNLAELTGIPAAVWVGAFTVFAGYALYLVARWLLVDPTT